MRTNLFPFQQRAVNNILDEINSSLGYYATDHKPQVIAFRAPTGAGKTLVMATVIEDILFGNDYQLEHPESVFVWLSDSPQLNEQSRLKIITRSDKIQPNQCITISEDSFDQEVLDDGRIYFLNTQKLSKTSRLVQRGDARTYTIWETLQNTADRKADHFYVIIDEAHRGMQDNAAAKATTIMQKFLKGSKPDNLSPMPIVIGMSATDERFRRLVGNMTSSVRHDVAVHIDEVRSSGLLKDRILITYPEDTGLDGLAILEAAAEEWRIKSEHWDFYCRTQHAEQVRPILVVQVENQSGNKATATNLADAIAKIEAKTGARFAEYEVVHTFGQTATIDANGYLIHHVDASDIADNKNIRVVFFKENLSTGWDCPRAETMMSFRRAEDATYIAQLLGRMIRTPLRRRIEADESLNEVRLFLPFFNKDTVNDIVQALRDAEGGDIPADIDSEEMGSTSGTSWTTRPRGRRTSETPGQIAMSGIPGSTESPDSIFNRGSAESSTGSQSSDPPTVRPTDNPTYTGEYDPDHHSGFRLHGESESVAGHFNDDLNHGNSSAESEREPEQQRMATPDTFDREEVAKFINDSNLLTYVIRPFAITKYLQSLINLAVLVKNTNLNINALIEVQNECAALIETYIAELKADGLYDAEAKKVKTMTLNWKMFDVFGQSIDSNQEHSYRANSDEIVDRQFRVAEKYLGDFGMGNTYVQMHYDENQPNQALIDVVLFAAKQENIDKLHMYAKDKFHCMSDQYRLHFANMREAVRKQYDDIVSNGNQVSKHTLHLPDEIRPFDDPKGDQYYNHLFVDPETGYAQIKLDTWEKGIIDEESQRPDFVCWLRNPPRAPWALCLKRMEGDIAKAFYPDFIIVRNVDEIGYVLDILEPHRADLTDNLSKAKAMASYSSKQPNIGRIQLIREGRDSVTNAKKFIRLDLAKSAVKDKIQNTFTVEALDTVFKDSSMVE